MPQTQNVRTSDVPYGRGSLHNALLDSTFRTRRRAAQINMGESARLELFEKMMTKHQEADAERKARLIGGVRRRVEELRAYRSVLKSYSADNLQTLQWGFHHDARRDANTPRSFQRYKIETKIYHCGFTVGTLYPEISKTIEASQPARLRERYHSRMHAVAKRRSDFLIDRKVTNAAMKREKLLADKKKGPLFLTNENTVVSRQPTRVQLVSRHNTRVQ